MERANASAARRSVLPIRIVNLINAESNHAYQRAFEGDVPLCLGKRRSQSWKAKRRSPEAGTARLLKSVCVCWPFRRDPFGIGHRNGHGVKRGNTRPSLHSAAKPRTTGDSAPLQGTRKTGGVRFSRPVPSTTRPPILRQKNSSEALGASLNGQAPRVLPFCHRILAC